MKAVQELSAKNDEKDQMIASLEARLDKLEAPAKIPASPTTVLSSAASDQNLPNPFGKNTAISYTLPQKYTSAQLQITEASGKLLKTKTKAAQAAAHYTWMPASYLQALILISCILITALLLPKR